MLLTAQGGLFDFRRRSGADIEVAGSLYQFPPGTDPSWLMPYQVGYFVVQSINQSITVINNVSLSHFISEFE